MIHIYERPANKLPEVTSLYIDCDEFYNRELFDNLVQCQNSIYSNSNNIIEFPINKLYYLVNLITRYDNCEFLKYIKPSIEKKFCDEEKFKNKLYKHQVDAINYGLNNSSWLLLDDCGLGKTLSMISLAEELSRSENLNHCLIVCGVNSLKYNWASEIEKFSDKSYTILGQTITKTGKVKILSVSERCEQLKKGLDEFFVITNIETLQNKEFAKCFNKSKSKFDMIVLDEAHHCKNPSSLSAKTLMKLKSNHKIALTGTIIMNSPDNAYVPLKWTENTKSTLTDFKNMFNVKGGFGGVQVIGHKNLDILRDLVAEHSLRRRKCDVLDLPSKVYKTEYVDMQKDQQTLYNNVHEKILEELDLLDHTPNVIEELTINMRLRQITAYPGIISSYTDKSAKLDRAEELVEEIVAQGDKVLIFNTFKGSAYELYRRLSRFGSLLCTGDQSDEEIADNKHLFSNDPSKNVMIATWQKMGTGHTLTDANYCIFIDTPWTNADFQQAADRIYRIGQNKSVTIITLITKDTYDERVQEILEKKEKMSDFIVDNIEHHDNI